MGDPFWSDSLDADQLRAVYGMLWAEDKAAREHATTPRPRANRPAPPPPDGAPAAAWATLMSMRSERR